MSLDAEAHLGSFASLRMTRRFCGNLLPPLPVRNHIQRVRVDFEYAVHFTRDAFDPNNACLPEAITRLEGARRHRVLFVLDGGLVAARPSLPGEVTAYADAHAGAIALARDPVVVPGGEVVKNEDGHARALLGQIDALSLDRQSFVVIAGGGAVLDMAGYAAAIAHRGIRVIRLPTTVLAQADSGVGVKNGINAFEKKNFVGTFVPPFAVIIDSAFLDTLSARDRIAGMAEAVKVALVRDAAFFAWIAERATKLFGGDMDLASELVERSARLHMTHIATSGDPFELGSARPLDFGHWAAHKLESLTRNRLRHGEAVAIGMAIDTLYSAAVGMCDAKVADRVLDTLEKLGFRLWDAALEDAEGGVLPVLRGLEEFREHLGGDLTVTMLRGIGTGEEIHTLDERVVKECIYALRERSKKA